MNNILIRDTMRAFDVKQWQLAKMLGIGEYTMCRKMREELPKDEQERIVKIIKENRKGD